MASVAKPDTILAWYRKLVAGKFDGSKARRGPGRPRISPEIEQLIMRMAGENKDWGYDRIVGALANLGHVVCDQTVGNVLLRHGVPPAPERKRTTTWREFIRIHLALLAGTDFFTAEVLTLRGLVTYYVLFSTAIPIPETQPAPQAIQAGTPEPKSTPQRDAPSPQRLGTTIASPCRALFLDGHAPRYQRPPMGRWRGPSV